MLYYNYIIHNMYIILWYKYIVIVIICTDMHRDEAYIYILIQ